MPGSLVLNEVGTSNHGDEWEPMGTSLFNSISCPYRLRANRRATRASIATGSVNVSVCQGLPYDAKCSF